MYIGKNDNTFSNILLGIPSENIFLYDIENLKFENFDRHNFKWMQKRLYLIEKCKAANTIGIVIGTLSTTNCLQIVSHVQSLLTNHNIRCIVLSVGKINSSKLANFPNIDVFLVIGCHESTIYMQKGFYRPLVTVFEIEMAFNSSWLEKLPDIFSTDFNQFLENGKLFAEDKENGTQPSNVSLVTGKSLDWCSRNKNVSYSIQNEEKHSQIYSQVADEKKNCSLNNSWQGLEIQKETIPAVKIEDGRKGLPIKYCNE